jgi:hypothetical protein
MKALDKKMRITDVADTETILRLVQSIEWDIRGVKGFEYAILTNRYYQSVV